MRWILRGDSQRQSAIQAIAAVDLSRPMEVELRRYYKPRTLAQNRAYWRAVDALAKHCGYSKEKMHDVLLAHYFGVELAMGVPVPKRRSSELKVDEMRDYLEWVPSFGAELGLNVPIGREDMP